MPPNMSEVRSDMQPVNDIATVIPTSMCRLANCRRSSTIPRSAMMFRLSSDARKNKSVDYNEFNLIWVFFLGGGGGDHMTEV